MPAVNYMMKKLHGFWAMPPSFLRFGLLVVTDLVRSRAEFV